MSILRYLNETLRESTQTKQVYHGDSHGLTEINGNYAAMFLDNSNQQEGPGIYFADNIDTAKDYGKYVVSTGVDISDRHIVPSREPLAGDVTEDELLLVLTDLAEECLESMFYLVSDYVEVHTPEELNIGHLEVLAETLINDDQARNVLTTLGELCDNKKVFVDSWLKHTGVYGTRNDQHNGDTWYALFHSDTPIQKI